jgi:hypothetical protein
LEYEVPLKESEILEKLDVLEKQKGVAMKALQDLKRQMYNIETELIGINLQKEDLQEQLKVIKLSKR